MDCVSVTELDTRGRVDRVRTNTHCLASTSWQVPTMTLPISLSAAAKRTNPSSISHLMQTALENPGIVSLAAGFVDQQSLPVEMVAQAAADLLGDPMDGRRSLQYGTTIGDLRLRTRLVEYLEKTEGRPKGSYKEAIPQNDRHDRLGPVDLSGLRGAPGPRRYRAGGVADLLRFPGPGRDARSTGRSGFRSTTAGFGSTGSRRPWLVWRARESSNGSS